MVFVKQQGCAGEAARSDCTMNKRPLRREGEPKYRGISFNRTLSAKEHITNVTTKARKGLAAVKKMACASMPQKILVLLYQTLVLSIIDYGFGILTLSKTQLQSKTRSDPKSGYASYSWVYEGYFSAEAM